MIRVLFVSLALALSSVAFELPEGSSQCLVGVADSWESSSVVMTLYEKEKGEWKPVGGSWKGRLGKAGLAWGLGFHPVPKGAEMKKEGDWKSPAGVFKLGGVWGYDKKVKKHAKTYYRQITSRDLWVEDPKSKHYNRHLVLKDEPSTDWEKKQQMKQNDPAHALKLFIAHNAPPKVVPGGGSSIFFHIWRDNGGRPTAGCTVMERKKLEWLIARMDPDKKPLYVLLPKSEYDKRRKDWKLP